MAQFAVDRVHLTFCLADILVNLRHEIVHKRALQSSCLLLQLLLGFLHLDVRQVPVFFPVPRDVTDAALSDVDSRQAAIRQLCVLQLALPLCQHIFALVDGKLCRHADRAALLAFAVIFLQHHLFEFHVDKAFFLICLLA